MQVKSLSVSQLNHYLAKFIDSNPVFHHVTIEGEVANVKATSYGYIFFSLVEAGAKLNCLYYVKDLPDGLEEGAHAKVTGRVAIYSKNGSYSLLVHSFETVGMGDAFQNFLQIKHELSEKGYFEASHKKQLPLVPRRIGVVTSAKGAALQDVLAVFRQFYCFLQVYVMDVKVQGLQSEAQILSALGYLEKEVCPDVILLTRGGGSYDELSVFNSALIAEKIYHCPYPVISAVGHEDDFFICDLVADLRAPTPTAAARAVIEPVLGRWKKICYNFQQTSFILEKMHLQTRKELRQLSYGLQNSHPGFKMANQAKDLERLQSKMQGTVLYSLERKFHRLSLLRQTLESVHPAFPRQAGYAKVFSKGTLLTSISQVTSPDPVQIYLKDGVITATVLSTQKGGDDEEIYTRL